MSAAYQANQRGYAALLEALRLRVKSETALLGGIIQMQNIKLE